MSSKKYFLYLRFAFIPKIKASKFQLGYTYLLCLGPLFRASVSEAEQAGHCLSRKLPIQQSLPTETDFTFSHGRGTSPFAR
jgi:hypothetical protein